MLHLCFIIMYWCTALQGSVVIMRMVICSNCRPSSFDALDVLAEAERVIAEAEGVIAGEDVVVQPPTARAPKPKPAEPCKCLIAPH